MDFFALLLLILFGCLQQPNEQQSGEVDKHGCRITNGEVWCEITQKCFDPLKESCVSKNFEDIAKSFCGKENVQSVYICGNHIKVLSALVGGGTSFYDQESRLIANCPVTAPSEISEECGRLVYGSNCIERKVC